MAVGLEVAFDLEVAFEPVGVDLAVDIAAVVVAAAVFEEEGP